MAGDTSSNALLIRRAVFQRAKGVPPAGRSAGWVTAQEVAWPAFNDGMLPALQVLIRREQWKPYGDANTGNIKFLADLMISITVLRGTDDPIVLDGVADFDLVNILDGLLEDNTFTNPTLQDKQGFVFEAISSVDINRGAVIEIESIQVFAATATLTFAYPIQFSPPAPNWLEEIAVTVQQGDETFQGARFYLGRINYSVSGPAGGVHGSASDTFFVNLEPGATFGGDQTVIVSDGGAGGTFTPNVGASGVGSVHVKPDNGLTSFRFTYTPAAAGAVRIAFSNLVGWNDPPAVTYQAT